MSLVVLTVFAATWLGRGDGFASRLGVARDGQLREIDVLIGQSDAQRKRIEQGVAAVEKSLPPLVVAKVRATAEADQLQREVAHLERRVGAAESSLGTLRVLLAKGEPVELVGRTYTPADLDAQARKVVEAHETLTAELVTTREAHGRLRERADMLEKSHLDARRRLASLKTQEGQVVVNKASLQALKEARRAAGDGGAELADEFERLRSEVDDLDARTRTELAVEDGAWRAVGAESDVDEITGSVGATKSAEDTLSEVEVVLARSGG